MTSAKPWNPFTEVLGRHTTPAPRRRTLRLVPAMLLGAIAIGYAASGLWLFAALFLLLALGYVVPRNWRHEPVFTEVSTEGVFISDRRSQRTIAWTDVEEVYARTSWAAYSTLRTRSGSTIALPGVSDEAARLLEDARAAAAVVARAGSTSPPG